MKKIAFVFPGQGSQYVGMGKDIYDMYDTVKETYADADKALSSEISHLCFEGPEESLKSTDITQPAVLVTSIACYNLLKDNGIVPTHVAGHSLGEYSALVAAGSVPFDAAVRIVSKRGAWMKEAVPPEKGTMAAVLGLSPEKVQNVCKEASLYGVVEAANYNSPTQVVVSGETEALEKLPEIAKAEGAKRVTKLNVGGPFHSQLMESVSKKLKCALDEVLISKPDFKFYSNVTGSIMEDSEKIRDALVEQVSKPVLWQQNVENMIEDGVEVFVEVGPGKVLSGLIKKINKKVKVLNVQDKESLDAVLEHFKGVESGA